MTNKAEKNFNRLLERLKTASVFGYAAALLEWDQLTIMPKGEVEGRAEILSTVKTEWFKRFSSPKVGTLLDRLMDMEEDLPRNHWFIVKRLYAIHQRAQAIPPKLYRRFNKFTSQAYEVWVKARKESDFRSFQGHLEEIVKFVRQFAELYEYEKNPYDALLPNH